MAEQPLVSILMTAYNREKYIAEAIESVMASTYQNWELIIVDDRSNDGTVEIATSYESKDSRIKVYVNDNNLGDYPNRNKAASFAKGKYLKYLDSDDIIYPCSLEIMVDSMEQNSDAGIGLSYNNYSNEVKLPIQLSNREVIETHFFCKGLLYIGPTGSIYNRDYFNEIGGFAKYGVASDYEFNLRAACYRPVVLFQRDLIWWRVHSSQEFRLKENDYMQQNQKILYDLLKSNNFPLCRKKRREIMVNDKKNNARKAIIMLFMLKFIKFLNIMRITKPGFTGFFFAVLPNKLRKIIIS